MRGVLQGMKRKKKLGGDSQYAAQGDSQRWRGDSQ